MIMRFSKLENRKFSKLTMYAINLGFKSKSAYHRVMVSGLWNHPNPVDDLQYETILDKSSLLREEGQSFHQYLLPQD